ncbi:MAG: hypothetical protein AAFN41_11500, partial [Planctomycetota bacterium]
RGLLILPTDRGNADWTTDLADKLLDLQQPDGSVRSVDDRWMEDNPVLITSYALIAAQNARQTLVNSETTE